MDVHSPEQRSFNMSMIKGKDTKPEMQVRKWLWSNGYRGYRLHRKDLSGKPDIVFFRTKKVIFIHGCFWHKHECKYFKWPKTNREFWKKKIEENFSRDLNNNHNLISQGWKVFIIWECELKTSNSTDIWNRIETFLKDTS